VTFRSADVGASCLLNQISSSRQRLALRIAFGLGAVWAHDREFAAARGRRTNSAFVIMCTIGAYSRPGPTLSAVYRPRPMQLALGWRSALAIVRSGDRPLHSRGRRHCRWATSRNQCCVAHPSANMPAAGPGVLPRRSARRPVPPTGPDSSPSPPAGRGDCATARRSSSRIWVPDSDAAISRLFQFFSVSSSGTDSRAICSTNSLNGSLIDRTSALAKT
jgi:hypothetical protein